jgi:hypothetical protein
MNATDLHLQNVPEAFSFYSSRFSFFSQFIEPLFNGMSNELVMLILRHLGGYYRILIFMNYLVFKTPTHLIGVSKHVFLQI